MSKRIWQIISSLSLKLELKMLFFPLTTLLYCTKCVSVWISIKQNENVLSWTVQYTTVTVGSAFLHYRFSSFRHYNTRHQNKHSATKFRSRQLEPPVHRIVLFSMKLMRVRVQCDYDSIKLDINQTGFRGGWR